MGCQASPTTTTRPEDAAGVAAGHSQRSTRGVRLKVWCGLRSMISCSEEGQCVIRDLAWVLRRDGSVVNVVVGLECGVGELKQMNQ